MKPFLAGGIFLKKINAYFITHPKVTLALTWIWVAIAAGLAIFLNIFFMDMSMLAYLACILVPAFLAVYFRSLYNSAKEYKREQAPEAAEVSRVSQASQASQKSSRTYTKTDHTYYHSKKKKKKKKNKHH